MSYKDEIGANYEIKISIFHELFKEIWSVLFY